MLNAKEQETRNLNRRCFLIILEAIQYLTRQGIPFRGHGSDEDSNFSQLLKMQSKNFPEIENWLQRKQDKFTSHDVQNELLTIMSKNVTRNLLEDIRPNLYALISDEYTDVSNKEQLLFCLRWVNDELEVFENFRVSMRSLTSRVQQSLAPLRISCCDLI